MFHIDRKLKCFGNLWWAEQTRRVWRRDSHTSNSLRVPDTPSLRRGVPGVPKPSDAGVTPLLVRARIRLAMEGRRLCTPSALVLPAVAWAGESDA